MWKPGPRFTPAPDWHVIDAFYFGTSTLTTTRVADPDLVLDDRWLKLFTVFFQLSRERRPRTA